MAINNQELLAALSEMNGSTTTNNGRTRLTQDDYDKYVVLSPEGAVIWSQVDGIKLDKLPEDQRENIQALRELVIEAVEALGLEFKPRGAQAVEVSSDTVAEARKRLQALKKAVA